MQLVALVVAQLSVIEPPALIVLGTAVNELTLAGGVAAPTFSAAVLGALVPPGPVQVTV
jgi:hypothetical protein